MEAAEALCESLAIVDRGRVVAGGTLAELKRASGRGRSGSPSTARSAPAWLAGARQGSSACGPAPATSSSSWTPRPSPAAILAAALARGAAVTRFEIAEPSLEAIFIERVGRPPEDATPATAARPTSGPQPTPALAEDATGWPAPRPAPAERRDRRAPRVPRPRAQPALPRLDGRADGPGPRASRWPRSRSATSTARPSPGSPSSPTTTSSATRAIAVADSLLNIPPAGADPATWEKPVPSSSARRDLDGRAGRPRPGRPGRGPDRRAAADAASSTSPTGPTGPADGVRSQLVGFAAIARRHPRLDVDACRRTRSSRRSRRRLPGRVDQRATDGGRPIDPAGGRQPVVPRDRVRRPDLHDRDHLRDVGRDRRRRREEQPGHGADDQRGVAAPAPDRQGRSASAAAGLTQYAAIVDPGRSSSWRSRTGSPRRSSGRPAAAGAADRRPDAGLLLGVRRVLPARVHPVRADLRRRWARSSAARTTSRRCRCR